MGLWKLVLTSYNHRDEIDRNHHSFLIRILRSSLRLYRGSPLLIVIIINNTEKKPIYQKWKPRHEPEVKEMRILKKNYYNCDNIYLFCHGYKTNSFDGFRVFA